MKMYGTVLTAAEVEEIIAFVDSNGDGEVCCVMVEWLNGYISTCFVFAFVSLCTCFNRTLHRSTCRSLFA